MKNKFKLMLILLLTAIGSLVIFIIFSIFAGFIWDNGYNLQKLNEIAESITQQATFEKDSVHSLIDDIHLDHPELQIQLVNRDGAVIYPNGELQVKYSFDQLASLTSNMPNNLWLSDQIVTLVYSLNNDEASYLILKLPSNAMKEGQFLFFARSNKALLLLILPLIVTILVPYVLSILLFSSMNRRIEKLNNALTNVNLESEPMLLEDKYKDEINQITQNYNAMAQRIKSQTEQIKQFDVQRNLLLSNLSHDLRTPLSTILGYAEKIRTDSFQNENELQNAAKIILQRSRYMDKLLDQLLNLSYQKDVTFSAQISLLNLSEMLRTIVAEYLLIIDNQNYKVEINISDKDTLIHANPHLIERMIRNLLDNAIRYGKDGQFLGIELKENSDEVSIIIKDHGVGIKEEDRKLIFDRFYRAETNKNIIPSLGFGLAIVREVVESHGGQIILRSKPHIETAFEIKLPVKSTLQTIN